MIFPNDLWPILLIQPFLLLGNPSRKINASHILVLALSPSEIVKPEPVVIPRPAQQSKSKQARRLDLSHPRPSKNLCEISVRIPPYLMGWVKQILGTPTDLELGVPESTMGVLRHARGFLLCSLAPVG
jgi:hypothetical protein